MAGKVEMVDLQCQNCGQTFPAIASQVRAQRKRRATAFSFCSDSCSRAYRGRRAYADGTCTICGKKFTYQVLQYSGKYCSRKCKHEGSRKPGSYIVRNCKKCGKVFSSWAYFNQKYCSRECAGRTKQRIEKSCELCGSTFFTVKSRSASARFCSRLCQNTWQARQQIRFPRTVQTRLESSEWRHIRRVILERDCYTCQNCESHRGLSVHHVEPWRFSHNNNTENLITLCRRCHLLTDRALRGIVTLGNPAEAL